jgi:AbiV family abortive infection protein
LSVDEDSVGAGCHPRSMKSAVPPPADLMKLASRCSFNARQLLCAAKAELSAGRASFAHALASLSLEEIGKAALCGGCLRGLCLAEPIDAKEFWDVWHSHRSKLKIAVFFLNVIGKKAPGTFKEIEALADVNADDIHSRKLRGLYVDYRDGVIYEPTDISLTEAKELVDEVTIALNDSWLDKIELYLDFLSILIEKVPSAWKPFSVACKVVVTATSRVFDASSKMLGDLTLVEAEALMEPRGLMLLEKLAETLQELTEALSEIPEELRQQIAEMLGQEKLERLRTSFGADGREMVVLQEHHEEWAASVRGMYLSPASPAPVRLCLPPAPVRLCLPPAPVRLGETPR